MTPPSSTSSKSPPSDTAKPGPAWPSYILVALLTASVTGAAALFFNRPQPQPIVVHPPPAQVDQPTPGPTDTPAPIVVFVSGAVQRPDVYVLPAGARVGDALDAAGGFADGADVNAVNQAEPLWDGAQVHVPALDELAAEPPAGVSGETRSGGEVIDLLGKLDINSATMEQLQSLPGIGEVKAQAILDGRPYASVEELERVTGIGPKTIEALGELVEAR